MHTIGSTYSPELCALKTLCTEDICKKTLALKARHALGTIKSTKAFEHRPACGRVRNPPHVESALQANGFGFGSCPRAQPSAAKLLLYLASTENWGYSATYNRGNLYKDS